ncbi:hypothetical protein [Microbacterium lacticum]|uniref:hypothetical protein n=1 Tax=Microbacterium lacticum TaxID=33885 RepID=UPI001144A2F1|nr:hypothetical protein [Microbacterium lacticum]
MDEDRPAPPPPPMEFWQIPVESLQAPPANRAWLASLAAAGRRGAWFNRTPHVVTAGPVLLGAATSVSSDAAPAP